MPTHLVQRTVVVVILMFLAFTGVECLFCYRCLSLDCPGKPSECESVQSFVTKNLRDYYEIGTFLPTCPEINNKTAWSTQLVNEDPCSDFRSGKAKCAAGRIQIITSRIDTNPLKSYATVLGCAKPGLLSVIDKVKMLHRCDKWLGNGTLGDGLSHSMEVEHCGSLEMTCSDRDFCVEPEESVVKEFQSSKKFEYGLAVGILVFVVIIIAVAVEPRSIPLWLSCVLSL